MEFLSIVAIVISIIAISRANDATAKTTALEKKLQELGNKNSTVAPSSIGNEYQEIVPLQVQDNGIVQPLSVPEESNEGSGFVKWLKEDWLLKLGGTLVLMGVLFFLSIAFTAVGPQGKVAIGYIFGVSLMLFGFWYAKKQIIGGGAIHVIGAVIIIITTYLARQPQYNLFDPYFATFLMFLTTVCVALTAYIYERAPLAHVGLALAGLVPVLTNSSDNDFFGLLVYLGVVTLGVLWLALITKWRTLVLLALMIVCAYSAMKITGGIGTSHVDLKEGYMLVVFGILFYVTSLFSILRSGGQTGKEDGFAALFNAGFALMWIISQVSHEMAPLVLALIALGYAVGFFFVYKVTDVYTSFIVYGGVALGLMTTSIMLELSGRAETIALLLIGGGATLLTYYLSNDEGVTKAVAFFNLLPLFSVGNSIVMLTYAIYQRRGIDEAWKDVAVIVVATVIYFTFYTYFINRVKALGAISLLITISLSAILVWQILHLIIGGGFATFLSILTYTIIGLYQLFSGTQAKHEMKIKFSKLWLGLVAAHVIFWDAWQAGDIVIGVLICVVIGILLLSSTFIIKKVATE